MDPCYRRDYLSKPTMTMASAPGFTCRAVNRLAYEKPSANSLTIETNRLKRDMKRDINQITPLLEYQLWLEAGKLDKISFKNEKADPNVSFNSNMWRNFRHTSGLIDENRKSNVSEAISTLYPINIPMPSQVGSNTLSTFYEQNRYNMFGNDKSFNLAVARVENEATFMRFLRLKSEIRNPPLDYDGSILPPKNFKTYPPVSGSTFMRDKSSLSENDYIHRKTIKKRTERTKSIETNLKTNSMVDFNTLDKATNNRIKSRMLKLGARQNSNFSRNFPSPVRTEKKISSTLKTDSMLALKV